MKKRSINVLGDPSPHGVEVVTVNLKRTFLILFCSLALAGCWLGTEAGNASFWIELQNTCNFPVQVTSPVDYFWASNKPPVENDLNPGEVATIYSHWCKWCVPHTLHPFGYSDYAVLKMIFHKDYTITIRANGQEQVLNSVQFLELVKRAKKKDDERYDAHWIIKDPSLCPVAAEKD